MKKTRSVIVLVLVILSAFFSTAIAGEKDVLKALEKVKGSVEAGVTYLRYCDLMADAKVEIDIYKRGEKVNYRFLYQMESAYEHYWSATKVWGVKMYEDELRAKGTLQQEDRFCEKMMQNHWSMAAFHLMGAYEQLK